MDHQPPLSPLYHKWCKIKARSTPGRNLCVCVPVPEEPEIETCTETILFAAVEVYSGPPALFLQAVVMVLFLCVHRMAVSLHI